ncbi:hypothetical protein FOXYSP1_00643 [Fusarium oxysporum f. sp. phaseoli]
MFARSFTLYYTLLEVCYLGPFSCLVSFFFVLLLTPT